MGLPHCVAYFRVSTKLWSVDHQCQGSRLQVYLTVLWKRTRGGQLDKTRALISPSEIHAPRAGACPAASRFTQTTSPGTELGLDLGQGCRFKCLKWSQVLQELLPWEILYPTSLLDTCYPALQTECADRDLVTNTATIKTRAIHQRQGILSKPTEKNNGTSFFISAKVRKNSSWVSLVL